jgi:hypothetical protein
MAKSIQAALLGHFKRKRNNAQTLAAVRLSFPHSRMTLATVNWYRNKYRREHGDSIPTEHSLR